MPLLLFSIFGLFLFNTPSEPADRTYLMQDLQNLKTEEAIDELNNRAFNLRGSYPDSLLIYAAKTLEASQNLNYQLGIAQSYTNFGVYHYQKSNNGTAIDYYLKAKEIYDQLKLTSKSASTSNNIGLIYFREKDYKKALEYHQEAIDLTEKEDNFLNRANYKLNKALAVNFVDSFDQALPIYYEAIRDLEQTNDYGYLSNAYLNLGNRFGANGKLDSVKKYFDKGLMMAQKTDDFEALSYAYTSQIKYYVATDNPDEALDFAEKSLSNALKSGVISNISDAYNTISQLQESLGNVQGALDNLKNHYTYKDSLRQKEQTLEIARIEGNKLLEREKAIFDLELKTKEKSNQQKLLIIGLLFILFLISIILFIMVNRNLNKSKKQYQLLKTKNEEIRMLAMNLKRMNEHQNQIFSIIGHDLTGPVKSLVAVAELINEKQLDSEDLSEIMPHLSMEIKRAGITLENLLHWSISQKEGENINPEHFNLKLLFNEITNSLQYAIDHKQHQIKIEVDDSLMLYADKQMIQIALRNILSNAIKFTNKGGLISCSANVTHDKMMICIEDNGIGISEINLAKLEENNLVSSFGTNQEKGTGLGIALCKRYVEKNNGEMEIQSKVNQGTIICLSFPITQ
ncbi:Signal transduction histidine kinase [Belliella buryatensis]|uniref:histidine kinase n=1 Tax=Belliella buryatensis TaxID=1500549 RepID=A0A239GJH7_9BACT|nr:tetratricopeptide repeat-containing sensor histidine kinase [Belliella buryatensis]SNS69456.1 Signal transduction histidine kinase [Belliella buryatensis]